MRTLLTFLAALFASLELYASDPVQVIVEFYDAPRVVSTASRTDAFAKLKSDARGVVTHELRNLVSGAVMTVPRGELAAIGALPYVKSVRVARRVVVEPVRPASVAPQADAPLMPHVEVLGAGKLWEMGARGQGVVVALIDTGIDYARPELGGCLGPQCRVIGGYNFIRGNADPAEGLYHGTPVAGIIGGNSSEYVGIAPEVKFLAYAIGSDADILAAMERAVDPNGDGDFSDRADIMNLSVGTGGEVTDRPIGSPSDLWAQAADNATRLGTLVVAATGNMGEGHSISNPSMAKTALAVGLADRSQNFVAGLTGRGPTPEDLTIKPDVIAPGDGAWALDRRGITQFGGTSSATPHATGAAALLLSLHPDWTPARLKQALMNTAVPFANDDVLSQGAGMIRVDRAAVADVAIETPSLPLGLYPLAEQSWTQTRSIRVANHGDATATLDVSATEVAGASVTVTPSQLSIPAGGHADLDVRIEVTAAATPAPLTFGVGGYIRIGSMQVPWAAVKAARATVVSDAQLWTVTFFDANGTPLPAWTLDPYRSEIILAPGDYDMFAWGEDFTNGSARLAWRPKQRIDGDHTIALTTATARKVTLDARDELGQVPEQTAVAGWLGGVSAEPFRLDRFMSRTIYVDPLPAGVQAQFTESWYDFEAHKLYVVPHEAIGSGTGNVTLSGGGAELERATARAYLLPAQRSNAVVLEARSVPAGVVETLQSHTVRVEEAAERLAARDLFFDFEVLLGPDKTPDFHTIVNLDIQRDGRAEIEGTMRRIDDAIVADDGSPSQYAGNHFVFGRGIAFPLMSFNATPALSKFQGRALSIGAAGELRSFETVGYTTFAPNGSVWSPGELTADTGTAGTWRFETIVTGILTPAFPRQSKATFTFDPARNDFVLPMLTSLYLVDEEVRLAARLEKGSGGAVVFATADAVTAAIAYRFTGASAWIPLEGSQVADGIRRAGLSSIANIATPNQHIDLRIELTDASGNTGTYELERAFSIGPELLPKRRAVR